MKQHLTEFSSSLALSGGALLIGFLCGFALSIPRPPPTVSGEVDPSMTEQYLGLVHLLATNLSVVIALALGGLLAGLPTFGMLVQNGIVLGWIARSAVLHGDVTAFLAVTVPHGLFEVIGIWIAGSVGCSIPIRWVRYIRGDLTASEVPGQAVRLGYHLVVAVCLVGIAALIESTVSVWIATSL